MARLGVGDAPVTAITHLTWQCTASDCRLRFPTTGDHVVVISCPLCDAPIEVVSRQPGLYVPEKVSAPTSAHIVVLLDNIRSLRNVGAIFRTSDGAGVRHLYLCGITATPDNPKLAKTALGAEQLIGWTQYRNALDAVTQLKQEGYQLWALEGGDSAEPLLEMQVPTGVKIALVLGNETAGVDPAIIAQTDRLVALPMRGGKQSLNVSTAFGIAAYHLTA